MSKTKQITLIKCENEECEFYGKSEEDGGSFIAVVYYKEIHDFELSDNGEIGNDLTEKEGESLNKGYEVKDIKCRHCDEAITFPKKWKKNHEETLPDDFTHIGVKNNATF